MGLALLGFILDFLNMEMEKKKKQLSEIERNFQAQIEKVVSLRELDEKSSLFLGRKSPLNLLLKDLKNLSLEEKKELGPLASRLRSEMEAKIKEKEDQLKEKEAAEKNWLDVTQPGEKRTFGRLNLLSQTQKEIEEIFLQMGFEIADGPEIEDEWHNFDGLNMPKNHPARDMQDTFWLKTEKGQEKKVARTQTSNCQIRFLENHRPPFQIIAPGRTFRYEASDSTHHFNFHQFEALVVGREINIGQFKNLAQSFFSRFFQRDLKVRLRPSYFPFTEPSFEFDISCAMCAGVGCRACKNVGWLEIGGAGMVNQRVFEACGYQRNEWQGLAWGFGIERLAMMKYKVDDIRLFLGGDLRFIRQF